MKTKGKIWIYLKVSVEKKENIIKKESKST
jgi:hypothetical protein